MNRKPPLRWLRGCARRPSIGTAAMCSFSQPLPLQLSPEELEDELLEDELLLEELLEQSLDATTSAAASGDPTEDARSLSTLEMSSSLLWPSSSDPAKPGSSSGGGGSGGGGAAGSEGYSSNPHG